MTGQDILKKITDAIEQFNRTHSTKFEAESITSTSATSAAAVYWYGNSPYIISGRVGSVIVARNMRSDTTEYLDEFLETKR